jgi:hypothetical protein
VARPGPPPPPPPRHLREELDELAPGLWKRAQHATADLTPKEQSAAVAEMVGEALRQRAARFTPAP